MTEVLLAWSVGIAAAHVCSEDEANKTPVAEESDWLETEVVAGFRVWQILFLVVAGIGTLIVVCCCFTRCRIPRTRQEIEANHRRNQITLLFRSYLDRVTVDEVDLMWALDVVKEAAEKRKSKRIKPRPQTSKEELDADRKTLESEDDVPKPLTILERVKSIFKKRALIEFSDEESNQLSTTSVDNYSL